MSPIGLLSQRKPTISKTRGRYPPFYTFAISETSSSPCQFQARGALLTYAVLCESESIDKFDNCGQLIKKFV